MALDVVTLAERPDLALLLCGFPGAWPEFMYMDPVAELHYAVAETVYPEYTLLAVDPADPGPRAGLAVYVEPNVWVRHQL